MEEDVGGAVLLTVAGDASRGVREDCFGADGVPVVAHDVPLNRCKAEFAGGAEDVGAAGSVGRAEVSNGCA